MLEGIRVLDLSRLLPGPYATRWLLDLGAEVIKVERPPFGDVLRAAPPQLAQKGAEAVGAVYAELNRGKKFVGLDYYAPRGRELFFKLVERADVLLESFRPGTLARRGLGWEQLRAVNPRLVFCSLSGYGQEGPYRTRAGHDLNYIALAGILGLNGALDRITLPSVQIADLAGGQLAVMQILAALVQRGTTGQGAYLDVSLYDAALDWAQPILGATIRAGQVPARGLTALTGGLPCYNVYGTRDGGHMALGALEGSFWAAFCQAVDRPDLLPRQIEPGAIPEVRELFQTRTRAEWIVLAAAHDMCLEPVLDLEEALAHPQAQARLRVRGGEPVPPMGGDTGRVLGELGVSLEELDELESEGVAARGRAVSVAP